MCGRVHAHAYMYVLACQVYTQAPGFVSHDSRTQTPYMYVLACQVYTHAHIFHRRTSHAVILLITGLRFLRANAI